MEIVNRTMRLSLFFTLTVLLVSIGEPVRGEPIAVDEFSSAVRPILQKHCSHCHNANEQNGSVDFSALKDHASATTQYPLWRKVIEQVRMGSMPPEGETPLTDADKQRLLGWIEAAFDTSKQPDPGPPLTRQFTRDEYSQTIRDLLHVNLDAAQEAGIPSENVVDGFASRAGGLVMEPSLMEKYFTAADLALEKVFTDAAAAGARKALLVAAPSESVAPANAVRQVLQPFLRRAFRRPVSDQEVERYAMLADAAMVNGESFEQSIRQSLKPVLVSPNFLLRIEATPEQPISRIGDHELAVRMSYFLWGTMPDDVLLELADRGELSRPEELEKQVRRMLSHPKANSLTRHFLTSWLQLPHLKKALPGQNQFPAFTRSLRDAMERETQLFCDHLRTEDRSVLELLDADYTFANAELAKHYKVSEVPAKDFVKVALRPEDHRGGVLGMGSFLTMTSHKDRTKPTARGKWILEVLLGSPPPPPPANAGSFAPLAKDRPEPKSFREKLAQHAADANCVGCHRRVDPLGFSLENYDAIGAWRDAVGDVPVDNTGTLPGVGEFQGVAGLRQVLKARQPQFIMNLSSQTLSYALGREVSYYDGPSLRNIVATLEHDEYRFSTLILEVVKSYPFQYRKAE